MNEDKKVEDLPWNQPQRTYWHQYSSNTRSLCLKLFSHVESEHSVKSTHKKSQLTSEFVSIRASARVSMWEGGQNIGNSGCSIFSASVLETDNPARFQGVLFPLTWPRSSGTGKMWNSVGGFPRPALWTCNQYATNSHAVFCLQKILRPLVFYIHFLEKNKANCSTRGEHWYVRNCTPFTSCCTTLRVFPFCLKVQWRKFNKIPQCIS